MAQRERGAKARLFGQTVRKNPAMGERTLRTCRLHRFHAPSRLYLFHNPDVVLVQRRAAEPLLRLEGLPVRRQGVPHEIRRLIACPH